ncbi:hypothetical protein HMPREF9431_01289 [Segatella oulorum F0390]|uniref:Uncharacterized protein n=1 Tax=Segatella oulorum F0390 TaxID=702438 RepID=G1WBT8_9BACT|nr:hypothetical protein HMPREF9431_01289 [Segatella oulorum F0390]
MQKTAESNCLTSLNVNIILNLLKQKVAEIDSVTLLSL